MALVSKKEIIQKMEEIKGGQTLGFRLSPTFGSGVALIELNPQYPEKGQKKYRLRWGKDERDARAKEPLMSSDKAKNLAGWVSDRAPSWLAQAA